MFEIGTKVKSIQPYDGEWHLDLIGTVVSNTEDFIGVDFGESKPYELGVIDNDSPPHNLGGRIPTGTGWYFPLRRADEFLIKVEEQFEFEF